jgi:hypothetical protein
VNPEAWISSCERTTFINLRCGLDESVGARAEAGEPPFVEDDFLRLTSKDEERPAESNANLYATVDSLTRETLEHIHTISNDFQQQRALPFILPPHPSITPPPFLTEPPTALKFAPQSCTPHTPRHCGSDNWAPLFTSDMINPGVNITERAADGHGCGAFVTASRQQHYFSHPPTSRYHARGNINTPETSPDLRSAMPGPIRWSARQALGSEHVKEQSLYSSQHDA